jgi:hypothetical protein
MDVEPMEVNSQLYTHAQNMCSLEKSEEEEVRTLSEEHILGRVHKETRPRTPQVNISLLATKYVLREKQNLLKSKASSP